MPLSDLQLLDSRYIWHPFTQQAAMHPPLPVLQGKGALLYTEDGTAFIDAISSWWLNLHGHAEPTIAQAIADQAHTLEQVIFTRFTHPPAVRLAERLAAYMPQDVIRFFYSDDGSTAVEVALKIAIQARINSGQKNKTRILAFDGGYHGDTFGAMSVSGRGVFTAPFNAMLFDVTHIPVPKTEAELQLGLDVLSKHANQIAAFIFEPQIQGAAGMNIYPKANLLTLMRAARDQDITLIADEVMTGFGRTGNFFASFQHQDLEANPPLPDIICMSKGITGGFLPMGLTAVHESLYAQFLGSDYSKAFLHGHSYTANPLACAAANASLTLLEMPERQADIRRITALQQYAAQYFANCSGIDNARALGTILAFDVIAPNKGYLSAIAPQIGAFCLARGVVIRPLGNVVYVLPPYCTTNTQLEQVYAVLEDGIKQNWSV